MYLSLRKFARSHLAILTISFVYLILASTNLTLLPIGNDEGIYLDWGMRTIAKPGYLYYPINDGKTPLLMWLFGASQKIFSDPLFAGRIVSVMAGLVGLIGIYRIGTSYFDKRTAIFSSILFSVTPIIFFYNRQSLMEAGVAATGIWATYYFLRFLKSNSTKDALKTGAIVGVGFFIKTNAAIFLAVFLALGLIKFFKNKKRGIKQIGFLLLSFLGIVSILLINPDFWRTLHLNSRYSHTFFELIHFPVGVWWNNTQTNISILLVFVTPLITLASFSGLFLMRKKYLLFVAIAIIPIVVETILARSSSQRYLVSFLPLMLIGGGFALSKLENKRKYIGVTLLTVSIIVPSCFVYLQIFSPRAYFSTTKPFSQATETSYIEGSLSGYGVNGILESIRKRSEKQKIFIGIAENAGNPESALQVYLENEKNIKIGYIEHRYFGDQLIGKECIKDIDGQKLYFVSRSNYLVGLENFLTLEEKIKIPATDEYIGLHRIRENCAEDKTLLVKPAIAN